MPCGFYHHNYDFSDFYKYLTPEIRELNLNLAEQTNLMGLVFDLEEINRYMRKDNNALLCYMGDLDHRGDPFSRELIAVLDYRIRLEEVINKMIHGEINVFKELALTLGGKV